MKRFGFGGLIAALLIFVIVVAAFYHVPVTRGPFTPQIAAGDGHTLVLTATGELYGYGRNSFGQLGSWGGGGPVAWIVPGTQRVGLVQSNAIGRWVKIAAGGDHSLAIGADGSLWTWGRNDFGQLGDATFKDRSQPERIGHDTNWAAISGGLRSSVALKRNGTLWTWGADWTGQLGQGLKHPLLPFDPRAQLSVENSDQVPNTVSVPTQVGRDRDWGAIAAGGEHALGLKADGSLWGWGRNDEGQVGDGTFAPRSHPVRVGIDQDWAAIAAGGGKYGQESAGLKQNGSLWAWGTWNSRTNRPTQLGGDKDWVRIAAGSAYTMALKSNGSMWAVGVDYTGPMPTSSLPRGPRLRQIGGRNDWTEIAIEEGYECAAYLSSAVSSDGTLWAWGEYIGYDEGKLRWNLRL